MSNKMPGQGGPKYNKPAEEPAVTGSIRDIMSRLRHEYGPSVTDQAVSELSAGGDVHSVAGLPEGLADDLEAAVVELEESNPQDDVLGAFAQILKEAA